MQAERVTVARQQSGMGCTSGFEDGWSNACTDADTAGLVERWLDVRAGGYPFFTLCHIIDPAERRETHLPLRSRGLDGGQADERHFPHLPVGTAPGGRGSDADVRERK